MIKKESNLIITIIIINFYRDVGIALICFWSTTNRNGRRLCEARNDLHRSCRCSRKQVDASVGTFACIRTPRLCCSVKVRILCRSRNILRRRDRWNGSLKKEKKKRERRDVTISPLASNNIESCPRAIDSANTRAICFSDRCASVHENRSNWIEFVHVLNKWNYLNLETRISFSSRLLREFVISLSLARHSFIHQRGSRIFY